MKIFSTFCNTFLDHNINSLLSKQVGENSFSSLSERHLLNLVCTLKLPEKRLHNIFPEVFADGACAEQHGDEHANS